MLNLSTVTLLCVETRDPELAHWAIDQCRKRAQFAKTVLITDLKVLSDKRSDIEYIQAPEIKTTKDYSDLLLTDLDQYVIGSHVLVIQWDSFVIHPELWTNKFLDYDYIGPVWPHHPETPVGNGGFSLRSVKLLKAIKTPGFLKKHPEDYCICVDNKIFLERQCDIQIAPVNIAEQFGIERSPWHKAFGFHGFFNFGKVLDDVQLRDFLTILPNNYVNGLDSYDLIADLIAQGRIQLAKEIAKKIRFKWKMRKRFFSLKYWQLIS